MPLLISRDYRSKEKLVSGILSSVNLFVSDRPIEESIRHTKLGSTHTSARTCSLLIAYTCTFRLHIINFAVFLENRHDR